MAKQNVGAVLSGDDEEDVRVVKPRAKKLKEVLPGPSHPGVDRVRIQLEESDNIPPTGQFFGINGRSYMLKPGIPADVPKELINVLNDAVQDVPEVDPFTQQIIGYRKKLRYPYRVVTA